MDSTVLAAVVAGVVSLIVAGVSSLVTLRIAKAKGQADEGLLRLANEFNLNLKKQADNHEREMASLMAQLKDPVKFGVIIVARAALQKHPNGIRSFEKIKDSLPGFTDDQIRQILLGLPAQKVAISNNREGWKLI